MKNSVLRSPFFYVGDKYKLMPQLLHYFPENIDSFYEPFMGGGTVSLNVIASRYFLNDIDKNLVNLHKMLLGYNQNSKKFFKDIAKIIEGYDLSRSYKEDLIPNELKKAYKKTYYAKFNKEGYETLKKDYNFKKKFDGLELYILLIYGFNRMLRFNGQGNFNLPVGNVDFNKNVEKALNDYFMVTVGREITLYHEDFTTFLDREYTSNDFIYVDPPYLITFSEYNKLWNENHEIKLLNLLDELNNKGIKFGLSNVTYYKGRKNLLLTEWMKKYKVRSIRSNYISYHNNSMKDIVEVFIYNY